MIRALPGLLALTLLGACSKAPAAAVPTPVIDEEVDESDASRFRGYDAVELDIMAKVVGAPADLELYDYLGDTGDELAGLLGRSTGFGVRAAFKNGGPNAMNALVWRLLFARLANDISANCEDSELDNAIDLELKPDAAVIADALCSWPDVSDQTLSDAWTLVIGYAAPDDERQAFIDFAHSADLQERSADDALPSLWLGLFLHPAFLLEP